MKGSTKILGGIALLATISFMIKSSRENGSNNVNHIEGLNIDINSDKIINGLANKLDINGKAKEVVGNVAKRAFAGFIDAKMGK